MAQAFQPHCTPAVSYENGIGWMAHCAEQERSPAETCPQESAAHVVHVVAIPIVGRADRDDRLQRRWAARGNLQCVESTPGDPHHADDTTAPMLCCDPCDDFQSVVLLLLGVLIEQQAVRLAAATDIDPNRGIAM